MTRDTSKVRLGPSLIHGSGVFAARGIRAGERVLELDDSRVVTEEAPLRPELGEHEHHCDYLGDKVVLMGVPERYVNHSCEPNTYVRTIGGVRWVIALRDIRLGEEITFDYCINLYGGEVWECSCGAATCRKTIEDDFFALPPEKLREYLPLLDDWFAEHLRSRERVEALWRELGLART